MLNQDAPLALNEARPEQVSEREREIRITVIVDLLPRIDRTSPHARYRNRAASVCERHQPWPPSAAYRAEEQRRLGAGT
jgi:hypothetical protein